MLKDKAMIIIAVSKYAGAYNNLPGAITSARRLREWAEQFDEDCKYKILYLADDIFDKIDVQLVREQVRQFVNNNFIDRLIVYFAGHGIVRSAGDQFWLLTNAAHDLREGINIEGFRRGLLKCNIGNTDFAGQLCIIGDACRNPGRDAIDFQGDSILTSTKKINHRIQLDKFLSTGLGRYSFQIPHSGNQSAYCLFSQVMLGALQGNVPEAIETEFHPLSPVVTNHKLAEYLEIEVRNRAAEIQEEMEPDLLTGIRPPYNFYKRLSTPTFDVTANSQDKQLSLATKMAINDSLWISRDKRLTIVQERRKDTFLQWKNRISPENIRKYTDRHLDDFLAISDFRPNFVAAPLGLEVEVMRQEHKVYQIMGKDFHGQPILINQGEQWTLLPNYPNVISIISHNLPGDILLLKNGLYLNKDELWDMHLSDFSNLSGSVPLRAADAQRFADKVRSGKEKYPHQAVIAGYLYEFSNDYDNIARTAHYMARNTGTVPFDLALLCADKVWWDQENGKLAAFADLPRVRKAQDDIDGDRPYYTRRGFLKYNNVRLWGIVPTLRQGWNFMQTELYLQIPENIRLIGEDMSGRSAVSMADEGLRMFLEAFNYQVIETGT